MEIISSQAALASSGLCPSCPLLSSAAVPKAPGGQPLSFAVHIRRPFVWLGFQLFLIHHLSLLSVQPAVNTRYQILAHQPSTHKARSNHCHLIICVKLTKIMTTGKFTEISVKVLATHLVIGAFVRTLEHRPKRLNTVDLHVVCDILTRRMAHELVLVAIQLLITDKVIAHHTRTRLSVLFDKTMYCSPVGVVYYLDTDLTQIQPFS